MVPTGPVARRYHDLTAHSPDSVRASGHELDWENKPFPFKVYTDIPGLHLPREIDVLATPALAAIAEAAADAPPGRRGATLVLTGLVWRNSWKYRARTYRHLFWDGGTMLANALATAAALGLAPRLFTGFVDAAVHRLLGIDGAREVALALLSVGPETPPAASASVSAPIEHATLPLSRHVVDEPLVAQAHAASALATPEDVVRWRAGRAPVPTPAGARLIPL